MGFLIFLVVVVSGCTDRKNHQNGELPPNIIIFISDDQSWPHASAYGDKVVNTPAFDWIASQGVLFENVFNSAPACAPSRAAMLTGKNFWELDEGAIHFSFFPAQHTSIVDILTNSGYEVGYTGKGWGPGYWRDYRDSDPAGTPYQEQQYDEVPNGINHNHYSANFMQFFNEKGQKPFFFILGTTEPHRDLAEGMGLKSGKKLRDVDLPLFLPDNEIVRSDILDYYYEIEWFDHQISEVIAFLKENNALENTVLLATSDNGMAFPRAKSNLYDYGSRLPLAIYWSEMGASNRTVSDFVNLKDIAPTVLELAGIQIPSNMNGKSLVSIMLSEKSGRIETDRDHVVMGKELHAWCHPKGEINPVRAIRTDKFLYIRNLKPEMWPAGHPDGQYAWDLMPFGDVDGGPTKAYILENKNTTSGQYYFDLAFGKRPAEELYEISNDPFQLKNLAYKPGYQEVKKLLAEKMKDYLIATEDPRTLGEPQVFDQAPYFWSHGLATAGLPLYQWEALSEEEQQAKVDSVARTFSGQVD